jgi:hypothetical protein
MQRPEVRILEPQQTSNNVVNVDINSQEAYALLSKYNFRPSEQSLQSTEPIINDPNKTLTFEEMVYMEENKRKTEKQMKDHLAYQERNRPRAITFDDNNVQYHNTDFRTTEEGYGFRVQIVTNMKF